MTKQLCEYKFFSGLIKANPPKNTLYHSVQMVLVDPCDKFISRFWQLNNAWYWPRMTDYGQEWHTMGKGVPGGLGRDPGGTSSRREALSYFRRHKEW